jgi:hypothetical protein
MSKSITALGAAVVVPLFLSGAALAFNPQPDPPGKRFVDPSDPSLGGPDTKMFRRSKGGSRNLPAVQLPAVQKSLRRR